MTEREVWPVPKKFRDWSKADFSPDEWFDPAGVTEGFLAVGPVGTGKTTLLGAMVRELIATGCKQSYVRWHKVQSLVFKFRNFDFGQRQELFYEVVRCGVLVLDDLFSGTVKDDALELLLTVLDERMEAGRRTLVSTNVSGKKLQELDERLHDRVRNWPRVFLPGPSRRGNGAEPKETLLSSLVDHDDGPEIPMAPASVQAIRNARRGLDKLKKDLEKGMTPTPKDLGVRVSTGAVQR